MPLVAAADRARAFAVPVTQADQVLHEIVARSIEAYRTAPALRGRASIAVRLADAEAPDDPPNHIEYALGPGTDASFDCDGFGGVSLGDAAYLYRSDMRDVYVATDLVVDLPTTMRAVLFSTLFLPPQIVMRTDAGFETVVEALGLGLFTDLVPLSCSVGAQTAVTLRAAQGDITVNFDSAYGSLKSLIGRMDGTTFDYVIEDETSIAPENAVTFAADGRRRVARFGETTGAMAQVGAHAPDFSLPTIDGHMRSSRDARGDYLVLDFWALWCGPCIATFPALDALARRLRDSDAPVRIWTIAMVEDADREQTLARIGRLWSDRDYALPVLIDRSGLVAQEGYGIRSIPATVIVDSQGQVVAIEAGISAMELEQRLSELPAPPGTS